MMRALTRILPATALLTVGAVTTAVHAQAPWSGPMMQRGIAAVTCGGPAEDNTGAPLAASSVYTFGLVDLRSPSGADYGGCGASAPLWNAPMHHDPSWNAENLGNVYGITLDADGNIYLAAHGLYGTYRPLHHRYGNLGGGPTSLAAAGTVYRIDALTGAPSVFAVIPGQQVMTINSFFSSGPGLGNIAYDRTHDQFFVSSLEDGKIYRLDGGGALLNSFDPLGADNGAAGLPPREERVWAVEVSDGAVFYSIWNNGNPSSPGVIRRVALTGTGDFDPGSDAAVLTVPPQTYVYGGGTPISDITFTLDGQTMILGARTMLTDTTAYNHVSATHMAALVSGVWTPVGTQNTGCNSLQGESYGGVALGEEGGAQEAIIWTSSADMAVNYGPHGLFGVRVSDFPVSGQAVNSFKAPYDPSFLNNFHDDRKGSGGDIEILRESACAEIRVSEVQCPEAPGGPITLVLDIKNLGSSALEYVWLTPCLSSSLPAGAVTDQPQPSGIVALPSPLGPNDSVSLPVSLPGSVAGETVCFRVTLLNAEGEECCTEKVCVETPSCDCAEVLSQEVVCEPQADGTIKYTIKLTIKNLTHLTSNPYGIAYVSVLPPGGFSPSAVTPSPDPIPPGGIGVVELCYYGAPGPICFNLGLHDETLEECCSPEPICLELPECPPGANGPDKCELESKVVCSPDTGTAVVNFTICNNSGAPRTYSWSAAGIPASGCSQTLTAADFSPSSGVVGPIPSGGCATVSVTIHCEGFEPGDCAGYQICARHDEDAEALCCRGVVSRPGAGEPIIGFEAPEGGLTEISVRRTVPLTVRVANPTGDPMRAEVGIRDATGVLAFSSEEVRPPSPLFRTALELKPNEARNVIVQMQRLDDGTRVPDFTSLEIGATAAKTLGFVEPSWIVPVRLLESGASGRFGVETARIEEDGEPKIAITFSTVAGRRYGVEQSTGLHGAWTLADCATQDSTVDSEGYMKGTGSKITSYVDCDSSKTAVFFRIVEYQ